VNRRLCGTFNKEITKDLSTQMNADEHG